MQVVHTTVQANGHTKVEIVEVSDVKRMTLLKLVREVDYTLTHYSTVKLSNDAKCVILKCPQDKPWSFDVHTFTEVFTK